MFDFLYQILYYLLLGRIVFSFIQLGRDANPTLLKISRFVFSTTEPILVPLRNIVKPVHIGSGSYLDLSPLIALVLLNLLRSLLFRIVFMGF